MKPLIIPFVIAMVLTACGESAKNDINAGIGENVVLPEPNPTKIPTVNVAGRKQQSQ